MKTLEERLMSRVYIDSAGCWLWTGRIHCDGYGKWKAKDREMLAHRAMYELLRGEIPPGTEIDHLCRVRRCVNPYHMEAVHHSVNVNRGRAGERQVAKTHCPKGHPYSGDNLILTGTKGGKRLGYRLCRTCIKAANDAAYARRAKLNLSQ